MIFITVALGVVAAGITVYAFITHQKLSKAEALRDSHYKQFSEADDKQFKLQVENATLLAEVEMLYENHVQVAEYAQALAHAIAGILDHELPVITEEENPRTTGDLDTEKYFAGHEDLIGPLLTVKEAASVYRVAESTIRARIRRGDLGSGKIDGKVFVSVFPEGASNE